MTIRTESNESERIWAAKPHVISTQIETHNLIGANQKKIEPMQISTKSSKTENQTSATWSEKRFTKIKGKNTK